MRLLSDVPEDESELKLQIDICRETVEKLDSDMAAVGAKEEALNFEIESKMKKLGVAEREQAESTYQSEIDELVAECLLMHQDSGSFLNIVIGQPLSTKHTPHVFVNCERDQMFVRALLDKTWQQARVYILSVNMTEV